MSTESLATAADVSASCFSPPIEKTRNRANELLKRGIREHAQSLAQDEAPPSSKARKKSRPVLRSLGEGGNRTSKLLKRGIN